MPVIDIVITVFVFLALILFWIILLDTNRFVVRRTQVTDERIRKPLRAVVIADLHNKQFGKDNCNLLEAIRKEQPDVILVAGDILMARPKKSLEPAIHFIRELSKEYPIYYGNGNHEHRLKLYPETYADMADRYKDALGECGVDPLVNTSATLAEYGMNICGVEIDREYYRRFRKISMEKEYLRSVLGEKDKELYTVLLAHNPDYFEAYAEWGADLVLSGHLHGGVARVPFWGKGVISPSFRLFPKYDGGEFELGQTKMILSRGLGTHTIPVRVFNPGELWVVSFLPKKGE
ncbi:MAG: metallophosphoesterase [Acetatifactor sp.]|nr:metallophosphoesterase [Acetatifactor sp.]